MNWSPVSSIIDRFRIPALRPILIVGVTLVAFAGLLAWTFLLHPSSPGYIPQLDREDLSFVVGSVGLVVFFYLLTGLGILFPSRWGYRLFTAFLYVHLFVGFPITTAFAHRGLYYIKTRQVWQHFGMRAEDEISTEISRRTRITLVVLGAALVALYVLVMVAF